MWPIRERERENASRRNVALDILKAAAIILVVAGHCIQYGSGGEFLADEAYFDNIIFKIIYSFHMPLFMLISGYLFAFSAAKGSFVSTSLKKCKTILIPILSWSVLLFLIKQIQGGFMLSPISMVKSFISGSLASLWFLWAVLLLSVFTAFIRFYLKDSVAVYVVVFAAMFFIPDYSCTELFKFMYPYFTAGYFLGRLKTVSPEKHDNLCKKLFGLKAAIIYAAVYIVLIPLYNYDSYIYNSGICILRENMLHQLGIDIYRFAIGFAGSMLTAAIVIAISRKLECRSLENLGMNTMGIYIISEFINNYALVPLTAQATGAGLITFAEVLCVLVLCMLCIKIIKLSKPINKILLGGR